MFPFKILCVFLSIKIIENVPKQAQTAAKQYQRYEIEDDIHINEDQVNDNFLESESGTLESNKRKLTVYAELQSALQNLNGEQKFLFEDALNKYIMGNITENEVIDLLPSILLIDENSRELDKQHESNKYKSKSCPYNKNNSNFLRVNDPECKSSKDTGAIYLNTNMHSKGYGSMYTKYRAKSHRDHKYKIGETQSKIETSTLYDITTLKTVTVPLILDLIKSFKNKKISKTTTHSCESSCSTTTPNKNIILNDITTAEVIRENKTEDKSHMVDIMTLLTLLANMTEDQRAQTMLRSRDTSPIATAPLCPYTISFGTSPRYKSPYEYYNRNITGTLCYVCGLEESQIPVSSLCEDAFDDVDWTLKKYSYKFIKYCRYDEYINNYCIHTTDKRSIWGRWTGGCSVRKIDISGIYTQRTCRNQEWPTRGHHFASHRMARLEFVLNGVTDGCTISPSASLVPLSRSISLFARFIVCVCKGSLCNAGISYMTLSYIRLFAINVAPIILITVT